MLDIATHLTLFGLGSFCGFLLFGYDQHFCSAPSYDKNLSATISIPECLRVRGTFSTRSVNAFAAMVGGGILFNLPYFLLGANVGTPK
jgi:hypothetical protein